MLYALFMIAGASLASCGSSERSAGAACEASAECAPSLECVPLATWQGGLCAEPASVCSKKCTDDSGCADLGSGFKCFAICDGTSTCGEAG